MGFIKEIGKIGEAVTDVLVPTGSPKISGLTYGFYDTANKNAFLQKQAEAKVAAEKQQYIYDKNLKEQEIAGEREKSQKSYDARIDSADIQAQATNQKSIRTSQVAILKEIPKLIESV